MVGALAPVLGRLPPLSGIIWHKNGSKHALPWPVLLARERYPGYWKLSTYLPETITGSWVKQVLGYVP